MLNIIRRERRARVEGCRPVARLIRQLRALERGVPSHLRGIGEGVLVGGESSSAAGAASC